MPVKKKASKKPVKKAAKKEKKMEMEVEGGLDDLGGEMTFDFDEEDEKPAKSGSKQIQKVVAEDDSDDEEGAGAIDLGDIKYLKVKGSKPIAQIKKGDKMKVDGLTLEVDSHYVLMDHGKTKEMAIELFDSKTDKDYQLRYFSDQVDTSMEFYELEEIVYNKKDAEKVEW